MVPQKSLQFVNQSGRIIFSNECDFCLCEVIRGEKFTRVVHSFFDFIQSNVIVDYADVPNIGFIPLQIKF